MAITPTVFVAAAVLLQSTITSAGRTQRVLASPDIPITAFSCSGRPIGYYADLETNCQVYHMCGEGQRQYSYMCPNTTLFHQRMLICAHWYQVNCSRSELDYSANLLIGQRDKPFVPDYFTGLGEVGGEPPNSEDLQHIGTRRSDKSHSSNKEDLLISSSGSFLSPRRNTIPESATKPTAPTYRPTNVSFRSTIETPSSDPALARTQPMTRAPQPTPRTIIRPRRPSYDLEPPETNVEETNTLELHLQDPRRAFFIPEKSSEVPGADPIVVSIKVHGDSSFRKAVPVNNQLSTRCQKCHPLFIIDKNNCSPCVLVS
ncbi:uncharacterized protein [Halyomorpha halys]|uniref:uncharacterized protein n=1 Tax=Halyomorpha halys TaxID=286706 RepID=UPI0006D4DD65